MRHIRVEVAWALAGEQTLLALELDASATVADAIAAAVASGRMPQDAAAQAVGIYGRVVERSRRLSDGDRVEFYRPLPDDPKARRRERARAAKRR